MTTETATARPARRARGTDWTLGPAKWLAAGLLGGAGLVGLAWVMTARTPSPLLAQAPPPIIIEADPEPDPPAIPTAPIGAATPTEAPPTARAPTPDDPPDPVADQALTAAPEAAPSTLTRFVESPADEPPARKPEVTPPAPAREAPPPSIAVRINVNTADAAQLDLLPGVGPVIAERIIAERVANGPFRTLRDLERVRGIGPKTVEKLAAHVRFE